jgi:hypothetical protein
VLDRRDAGEHRTPHAFIGGRVRRDAAAGGLGLSTSASSSSCENVGVADRPRRGGNPRRP